MFSNHFSEEAGELIQPEVGGGFERSRREWTLSYEDI
jgi:hypothetical protein